MRSPAVVVLGSSSAALADHEQVVAIIQLELVVPDDEVLVAASVSYVSGRTISCRSEFSIRLIDAANLFEDGAESSGGTTRIRCDIKRPLKLRRRDGPWPVKSATASGTRPGTRG